MKQATENTKSAYSKLGLIANQCGAAISDLCVALKSIKKYRLPRKLKKKLKKLEG